MPLTRGRRPTGRSAGPVRSPSGSGATSTNPARSSNSAQVASWSGTPSTRSRAAASRAATAATGSEITTSGAPRRNTRRLWASNGSSACSGSRSTTPLSTTPPTEPSGRGRHVLGRLGDGHRAARSMARSATAPRGSTPCASAPRSWSAPQQVALTAVGVDDHAPRRARRHVRRHRSGQRADVAGRDEPGRAVHRPVLGGQPRLERLDAGRQEAERLDDVAHRLFEIRLLAVRRASGAVPARAQPVEGPAAPAVAAAGGQRVRERRGTGVVRAVAITQVREGRQEIPGVAALGRQPCEGLAERLGGAGLVRRPSGCPGRPAHPRDPQRPLEEDRRTWRPMLPAMRPPTPEGAVSGQVPKDYLRTLGRENGSNVKHAHRLAARCTLTAVAFTGASVAFVAATPQERVGGAGAADAHRDVERRRWHDPQRRALRRRRGLAGGVQRRRHGRRRGR